MLQNNQEIQNVLIKQFEGKYKIVNYIGQGSFSKVFKCVDNEQKEIALKVINVNEQSQYVIKNYLENERRILEQARDCDNVVKLIEYAQSKDNILILLEYCQFDLDQVRRQFFNSKIPEDLAIIIFRQIANGLAQLHKHRIMHRDLKLENIAVVLTDVDLSKITENDFRSATYKLIDFGLSKLLNDIDKTNTFIGTPATMAPEILNDELYSFEADIYSFGCCLFLMITGEYPYFEKKKSSLFKSIKSESAQFDLINNEELRNIIKKMLKQNIQERMTWVELYKTSFFQQNLRNTLQCLDFELEKNQEIYQKPKVELSQFQQVQSRLENTQAAYFIKSLTYQLSCQNFNTIQNNFKIELQNFIWDWNLFIIISNAISQIQMWQINIQTFYVEENSDNDSLSENSTKVYKIGYFLKKLLKFKNTLYIQLHQQINGSTLQLSDDKKNQFKNQLELFKDNCKLTNSNGTIKKYINYVQQAIHIEVTEIEQFLINRKELYQFLRKILKEFRNQHPDKKDIICSMQLTLIFISHAIGIIENKAKQKEICIRDIEIEIVDHEKNPDQLEVIIEKMNSLFGFQYDQQ